MTRQPEGQRAQATFQNFSRAPITVLPLSQHFFCKGTSFPHFGGITDFLLIKKMVINELVS